MKDLTEVLRVEICGLQTFAILCEPLPRCTEKKRHKWDDFKKRCKVCSLKYRRPKRLSQENLRQLHERISRLESILKQVL